MMENDGEAADPKMEEELNDLSDKMNSFNFVLTPAEDVILEQPTDLPELPEITPPEDYPDSYKSNSHKETLVLGFVRNFERQFKQLYSQRKPLWTIVPNECGVEKFVSTTIRPTLLPYKELYNFDGAARFISEFLIYTPLPKPLETPSKLVSPTTTMWNQHGNSFDFSALLCSLLEGAGYDAYCVHGYASKEVCEMDRARTTFAAPTAPTSASQSKTEEKPNKYSFKGGKKLESKFVAAQEKKASEQNAATAKSSAEDASSATTAPPKDSLHGLRVHCWVVVLAGKREVPEAFFIEPSTGLSVATNDANYLGIEAVWNSKNYWVNMQSCAQGLGTVKYDLMDTVQWEYIFPNSAYPAVSVNVPGVEEEAARPDLLVLDLASSWVQQIELAPKAYETRCPKGTKTIVYRDAKTELFAEYLREDGLVRRITRFVKPGSKDEQSVQETYMHRKDKLLARLSLPPQNKTEYFYGPGHKFFLRKYTVTEADSGTKHELQFYHEARGDGLETRTFDFHENYIGREDRMLTRRIVFDRRSGDPYARRLSTLSAYSTLGVITETFARNKSVPAKDDAARIVYDDEVISVTYHIDDASIVARTKEFEKPQLDDKGSIKPITKDHVTSFNVDPKAGPDKNYELFQTFQQLLKREALSKDAIMASEAEMEGIVKARRADEIHVDLEVSFYDTARNVEAKLRREALEQQSREEAAKREELEKDYLAPFLVQLENPHKLSGADAIWVRDVCLRDFKAARAQEWLEKEQAELQQKKQWYQKNQTTIRPDEEERLKSFCEEAAFRIKILQQRIVRLKETAPIKYVGMEQRLRKDPRLAKLLP